MLIPNVTQCGLVPGGKFCRCGQTYGLMYDAWPYIKPHKHSTPVHEIAFLSSPPWFIDVDKHHLRQVLYLIFEWEIHYEDNASCFVFTSPSQFVLWRTSYISRPLVQSPWRVKTLYPHLRLLLHSPAAYL